MYKIVFTRQASKSFQKLPQHVAVQIREKLAQVAIDPFAQHPFVTKLQNRPGYRLRAGDWRVIYDLQKEELMILVLKIASRGEVYR
ncbi:MAG: type II toxin-antitoxin system RelE/ParE family toxin [Anaerolineae bacterium]|nr:type II toxin-antitoxin system RelE/ParE family toxin [Anaerolineales bacterium]MCQ3980022.1 type II toxin-antitoxin system RelE/ParE family toxin [Anaerolineae bacterium]